MRVEALMGCSPWLSRLVVLATLGALTACGAARDAEQSAATSESVPAGGSGAAEATSVTANPGTGGPTPAPGPVDGSGSPVPFAKGEVSVTLDAGGYRVGAVIQATVSNGMDRPVHTEDFKTDCSIVILQRKGAGGWSDITGCALGRPTVIVTLGPGSGSASRLIRPAFTSPVEVRADQRSERAPTGSRSSTGLNWR